MFLSKRANGIYYIIYERNGRRARKSTGEKYKRDAMKVLLDFKQDLKEKKDSEIQEISLKEYSFEFLKSSEANHSWKTTKGYKATLNFFQEFIGNKQLSEIIKADIESFLNHRIINVSNYAARKDLICLSAAFNKAVDDGYLLTNPCSKIKRIKIPEKQPIFFSIEDFEKLLESMWNDDLKDISIFAVNTGIRQMELITLTWNQIDFKNNLLLLNNRSHITKSKKVRSIPLNEKAIEIINSRKDKNGNDEFIFYLSGNKIIPEGLSRMFKRTVNRAKLNEKLNFHSLRHSFATWLIQKGAPIYQVSKLLGHSDIKTTEIYTHIQTDDLRGSIELLNNN